MSNKRWKSDEKIELMKLFSKGKSYDEIGTILKRSPNAIKLRLESVVYGNLVKGKPISVLTRMLNTDIDTIKQLYYSHKSFRQSRGETVEDVEFHDASNTSNTLNAPQPKVLATVTDRPHISDRFIVKKDIIEGANKLSRAERVIERSLEKVDKENQMMESIIKNYRMKKKLRKLYIDNKLDTKSAAMFETLLKETK